MAKILLVDDDDNVLMSIEMMLDSMEHDVAPCSSVKEAIKVLGNNHFDMVITDILMPDRDGLELIQHVKAHHNDLPIIAIAKSIFTDTLQ